MKKPEAFPHKHTVSGMVIEIYSAPQVRKNADGTTTTYDSLLVCYHQGGRRVQ